MDAPLLRESWYDEGDRSGGGGDGDDRTELPSWLQEENDAQRAAASGGGGGGGGGDAKTSRDAPPARGGTSSWADDDDDAAAARAGAASGGGSRGDLPRIILGMRIANVGTAVLLMACSISFMINVLTWPPTAPARWVLAAYASLGGLLLLCLEVPLSSLRSAVALNFGFLYDPLLRPVLHALLASVAWSYRTVPGDLAAAALAVTAPANVYALCRHPSYGAERDAALEEEERRIEAMAREEKRRAVREIAERWLEGGDGDA